MGYEELLKGIYAAIPELEGKLTLEGIRYDARRGRALVSFFSDALVAEKAFNTIKREIAKALPKVRFSLRVASPSLADDFLRTPEKYAPVFNTILARAHPAAVSWIPEIRYLSEDNAVVLELPDDFSLQYFRNRDVLSVLRTAVYDLFRSEPELLFRLQDDVKQRLQRIEQERQKEAELLRETQAQISEETQKKQGKRRANGRIKGTSIADEPVAISGLGELSGRVTIAGKVISADRRDIPGKEMVLLSFIITDFSGSINCKIFLRYRNQRFKHEGEPVAPSEEERKALEDIVAAVRVGDGLKVRGTCQIDTFDRALVLMVQDINTQELPTRADNAPRKRVELHAHTQMSVMDATMSAGELIKRTASWGHPAIAITDHGVTQAYPEAFAAARKNKIKLIPGMEAYMIDSLPIVRQASARSVDESIVVVDFETTGLNTRSSRIIEIGAVRLVNGEIEDSFSTLVNPGMPLPKVITDITGITDQMLLDQPTAQTAVPELMRFIGDSPIAAHNASFDVAILQQELQRQGLKHACPQVDTLAFAQKLYPALKRFRLAAVCRHLGVSLRNAHRAVHDATATAQILAIMLQEGKERGANTLEQLDQTINGYTKGIDRHIILLAKDQQGLQNINRLVSAAHLEHFHYVPKVPRDLIEQYREGLLLGSACADGELFQAILNNDPETTLEEIAQFYDYLEVQPAEQNSLLIRRGLVGSLDELHVINNRIIALGEKLGIPVVATGDAHYLDPEDRMFRVILKHSQHDDLADEHPTKHLRTTEEMLDCFAYLGEEKAQEIVIDNPLRILDQIGEISLYPQHPQNLTTFTPVWETAEEDIRRMTMEKAHSWYGDQLPAVVERRIDKELTSIIGYGFATLYRIANKLVAKSLSDGYVVGSRGSVGSSLVATLCGITEVNPLPPHYRCASCRQSYFDVPDGYTVGVDLPDKPCPACGKPMVKDGFDIPFEVFLGFEGDKVPDIDLNFSGAYQATAHAYVEELFGKGFVFRAGTIGTLQEKTAFGLVMRYMEDKGLPMSDAEKQRLAMGCVGVKRTTGQHPGGIVVLPKEYDITQFTAVQHPADDQNTDTITTHYDFASMHDILVKLDILGHDDPTMIHMLERLTGVHYTDVPLGEPQTMSLFTSPDALGVTAEAIGCPTGTLGIPEFGTTFVRQMLVETQPTTMEELIRISGLSHGTNVWLGNARELIMSDTATLKNCICTRDDIMNSLIARGVADRMAFDAMERVRKGRGLVPEMESAMQEHGVEEWFIDSCNKIAYMFPKSHAVAYVTMALRVAWFKVHHPLAYYAAYFSIRSAGFDANTMLKPAEYIRVMLDELNAVEQKELSGTQKDEIVALELVLEMSARGYKFLPPDLYKSDAAEFLIEEGALRVPFAALNGFGLTAAQSILEARGEPFVSIEDMKRRTKVSSSGIELLREAGALQGLSDTNQVDFFSFL